MVHSNHQPAAFTNIYHGQLGRPPTQCINIARVGCLSGNLNRVAVSANINLDMTRVSEPRMFARGLATILFAKRLGLEVDLLQMDFPLHLLSDEKRSRCLLEAELDSRPQTERK